LNDATPGTLFLIEDHLNLMGDNPLLAAPYRCTEALRFLEMVDAYDQEMRAIAVSAAERSGIVLERGVLACLAGPTYETAAEAEMLRRLGAHAVNMSVVPEAISGRASGQRVLGLAVLTNRAGVTSASAGHSGVIQIAERSCRAMACVLDGVIRDM